MEVAFYGICSFRLQVWAVDVACCFMSFAMYLLRKLAPGLMNHVFICGSVSGQRADDVLDRMTIASALVKMQVYIQLENDHGWTPRRDRNRACAFGIPHCLGFHPRLTICHTGLARVDRF